MQGQQNIELYPQRTENKSKANRKSLEAILSFDNNGFMELIKNQLSISKFVIIDTNIFLTLPLNNFFSAIYDQVDYDEVYIENLFLKNREYLSCLDKLIFENKGLIVTPEVIQELIEFGRYWKMFLNQKKSSGGRIKHPIIRNGENIIDSVSKNEFYSLLKEKSREYIANLIEIKEFLLKENRILTVKDNFNENYHFRTLLRNIIHNTSRKGKEISDADKKIIYTLFINSLNYETGLITHDVDHSIIVSNVNGSLASLNRKLRRTRLYVKENEVYPEYHTYVAHVGNKKS